MDDTTVVIKGVDQTGPAFKSAARNAGDLERALKSVGKRGGDTPTEAEWRKRSEWMRRETNLTKQQAVEQERANRRVREGAGEIASMAARYISLGFAIDQARTGVVNFARDSEQLRVLQARSGAATAEMERLKKTVAETADEFGRTQEEVVRVVDEIREAGYMSVEQARQIAPSIISVARQFGVEGTKLAGTLGEFMNTMNIPADKAQQALNMMAVASNNLRVEFAELNRYAPELGENMKELGVTGVDGLSKIMSILGMMRENGFGSTTKAARFLQQSLDQIRSGGGVAGALGFDNSQWSGMMDRHIKAGGNFFDFYIARIKEARAQGTEWNTLFTNTRQQKFWQMMIENTGKYTSLQKELHDESLKTNQGFVDSGKDAQLQLDRLTNSWTELWKAVGSFAGASGATSLMQEMTAEMKRFSDMIERLRALMDKGLWGAAKDIVGGMTLPSSSSVLRGMMNGPVPKKDPFRGVAPPISRANGGPASAGVPHMVGERGQELFTPQTPGTITSNNIMADVDRNTERSSVILNEIRDILRKEQQDRETAGGSLGGGGGPGGTGGGAGGFGGINPGGGSPMGSLSSKMGALATQGGLGGSSGAGGYTPRSMTGGGPTGGGNAAGGGSVSGAEPGVAGAAGGPAVGGLAADRAKFARELQQKPWLREKILGIAAGENKNPKANLAVIESMMNRASARGTSLEQAALLHSSAPSRVSAGDAGRGGYYAGYDPRGARNPKTRAMIESNLQKALEGSNVSNYATDNASQGLAVRNVRSGRFVPQSTFGGRGVPGAPGAETFFSPGTAGGRGGPASRARYNQWRSRVIASGGQTTTNAGMNQPALNQMPDMPTEPPEDLRGTVTDIRVRKPKAPDAGVPGVDMDALRERALRLRSELSEPITIRTQMARGSDTQFRRASMRREVNREVRESAWNSYNDIGAA